MRVAFLGPEGTFTDEALRASAPEGAIPLPCPTVHDTITAVRDGTADRAVVPIENSLEGGVAATLDGLARAAGEVVIAAEVVRPISHCLIGRDGTHLEAIERVLSHPHATGQCARFLRERVPAAEHVPAASTAEAVRAVASGPGTTAAIGARLAARTYGCSVLAEGIEDEPGNVTRFVWLARADEAGGSVADADERRKTSVVFWGSGDGSPGWLVSVLGELAERDVNLTRIESRPRRGQLGHYMFFADLDGPSSDAAVAAALEAVTRRVEELRILGSYPAAAPPSD